MSNVSDTNEIVAARLLFPLARIFSYWGCTSIRLLDFHQPHDRPHVTAGSIGERKLWGGRSTSISARNA
jgi:hypothetical protein